MDERNTDEGITHEERETLRISIRLKALLDERGLTQKDLAEMTGIRPAAISALSRSFVERLNIDHMERIVNALELNDLNELITLELESELWNMSTRPEQAAYLQAKKDGEIVDH